MLSKMLENVREKSPLVHCITNYVTVNDCANILIACGGSPIMADAPEEAEEITSICGGLVINIGTLNKNSVESMFLAGKRANELGHPVILDPVGAGASSFRTDTAKKLLNEVKFAVIRGNISEIKVLAQGSGTVKGVDAGIQDKITEDNINDAVNLIKLLSEKTGSVITVTGAIDIVANKDKAYIIRNGHSMMSLITGSGCMLTAMTAAYITANPEDTLEAAAASVCAMGLCGENAFKRMKSGDGNSTYRNLLIDEIFNLNGEILKNGVKYEMR